MTINKTEKLSEIFRFALQLNDDEDVTKVRRINDSRWDSLANLTLVTALESEFGITLDSKQIECMTSYQAVFLLISEKNDAR